MGLENIHGLHWTAGLEILFLAGVIYYLILFFRGTRGAQVLLGFTLLMALMMIPAYILHLDILNWLLQRFSVYLAVAFVVISQPEIRRSLAELGRQNVFSSSHRERSVLDSLVPAVMQLADRKIGALIAIEQDIGLRGVVETGTRMDCRLSPELLTTVFFPRTPLHDGGVVISGELVVAAACLFPISHQEGLDKELGTRHRAAIGLTEDTDALVVVVSEETGTVSLACKGRLTRGLDEERLRRALTLLLARSRRSGSRWRRAKAQFTQPAEESHKAETGFASLA